MKFQIVCSPVTGAIYLAKLDKNGVATEKHEITQQAVNAVMQHMDVSKKDYECAVGELVFKPKGIVPTESA